MRMLVKASTQNAYQAALDTIAANGKVGGVAVDILLQHDASRHLYLECADSDYLTLRGLVLGASAWRLRGKRRTAATLAELTEDILGFAEAAVWGKANL